MRMHDWILDSVLADWGSKSLTLALIDRTSTKRTLHARRVRKFMLLHEEPWGSSGSVLSYEGPNALGDGFFRLVIKVQSGDDLEIEAEAFDIPS